MPPIRNEKRKHLIFDILLVYVLLVGVYFRIVGIDWGEYQYLHPDERFLVWVGSDIQPIGTPDEEMGRPPSAEQIPWRGAYPEVYKDCETWGGYFDASCSPLNPNNRGHGFYVYGTFPMFITRYAVEWISGRSGFDEMTNVGRSLSALADVLVIWLVYAIASRLYDRRVGLLAAAFSAVTVLQIQLSHYFAPDTFLNLFTYLAIYFAVRVARQSWAEREEQGSDGASEENGEFEHSFTSRAQRFARHPYFYLSIAFGLSLGSAVASKLNAYPVTFMLPAAFALTLVNVPAEKRLRRIGRAMMYLSLAAVVSVLAFRLFQPYAFAGPGFFGVMPNPQWVNNIREQRIQAGGDVDFPPALQWARRPVWFSVKNLVLYGLGLPLGVLAWGGFLWAGWQLLADKSRARLALHRHGLLWAWTAVYFLWQSLAFNPTMRYQLPVYPALAIFAGWGVIALYDKRRPVEGESRDLSIHRRWTDANGLRNRVLAIVIGGGVLLLTTGWAWAFTRIYVRPITRVEASRWIYQNVPGPINLHIETTEGSVNQPVPFPDSFAITKLQPFLTNFSPRHDGELSEIFMAHVLDLDGDNLPKTLAASIRVPGGEEVRGRLTSVFEAETDQHGIGYLIKLDRPVQLTKDVQHQLQLSLESEDGTLTLLGSGPANESSWDDGLPLRLDGYDAYGGIYQTGLNLEMYWDDNSDKFQRIVTILDKSDYIFFSSNRQWGTIPRLPERYPLSSAYYRHLLGCPPDRDIVWCYSVAQVGTFKGELGFELVKVFDSSPRLGPITINTQFAEEAFSVYDHPKVLIFRKTAEYDPVDMRAILGSVDYTKAVHVTPRRAGSQPKDLLLPSGRWAEQRAGGTWSELFDTQALPNRIPALGALWWYAILAILGWVCYPLVRLALPGLADRGFPLARIAGLLLLSYLVWVAGSLRIPFTRITISAVFGLILIASLVVIVRQRDDFRREWRERSRYYLLVEGIFLAFFVFDLLIRLANPDLWHPWKGGEKPMDFSYLNAVLKSTTFPPYDPWFAGGYLNYYYYGFVFVGVLIKWLGIVPAIAYNLVLPSIFAMIALGAFSLGWNLFSHKPGEGNDSMPSTHRLSSIIPKLSPFIPGMAAAFGVALLGNLGTVRMIFQGYQRLVAPGGVIEGANLLTRWTWALRGFARVIAGADLPYAVGDWYWIPSRAIPALGDVEPITEFPFFTVLYGDPHAHLFAIPIALLALSFALSFALGRSQWRKAFSALAGIAFGSMVIGALYPVNLSDIYTYLPIGAVAVAYGVWRSAQPMNRHWTTHLPPNSMRFIQAFLAIGLLVLLSFILYQPYRQWYGQAYTSVDIWKGTHTPLWAYLTHWGLFLFLIISWMVWETREWMASTPASSLSKLKPYMGLIQGFPLTILLIAGALTIGLKVGIAWFVLPLAAWAGVLLLRPGLPDNKRFVLFLVGTALILTLMVEVVVVRGDIGRMNTVFKFYLQTWTILGVCAAAALGWQLQTLAEWRKSWRLSWQFVLVALVFGASLFPVLGGIAKVRDRMTLLAPNTLDGMAFMQYAEYPETWGIMDLSQDYHAIRWMQENIQGSPVIVEANQRNLYRWGSRFTIYTGLPGVVGWEWHQQQQRASLPGNRVSERIAEIENFYITTDLQLASDFLRKYEVRYIILGQQERGLYSGEQGEQVQGLAKFPAAEGVLWRTVYQEGDTIIYEVIEATE